MARRKIANRRIIPSIILDMDDPTQARLRKYYLAKTRGGKASDWIRQTLIAAIPADFEDAQ